MYHVIFNAKAKHNKSRSVLEKVLERFRRENKEVTVHETERKGHAEEIARELSQTEDVLVAIGGDGTFHEVLNGISDLDKTALLLIPGGTGNDFATSAELNTGVDALMDKLLYGKPQPTDFIELNDRRSLNIAGTGIDVDVLERTERGIFHGRIKYLMSLLQSMFLFRACPMRVAVNGQEWEGKALFAAACNGSDFGGGIRICPGAKIDDGKLELIFVPQLGFFQLISAFVSLMRGKILEYKQTLHIFCEELKISGERVPSVQLDGEIYRHMQEFNIKIGKGLKLYR